MDLHSELMWLCQIKHGEIVKRLMYNKNPTSELFWSKTHKEPNNCWRWLGAFDRTQPKCSFFKESRSAGRTAIFFATGEWPSRDLQVAHTCGNSWCVNPEHLQVVTHLAVMQIAYANGRLKPCKRVQRQPIFATCHPTRRHCGRGLCKSCYNKQWYQENRERTIQQHRKYRESHGEIQKHRIRNWYYKKYYGISVEEYNSLLQKQNGVCAICKQLPKDRQKLAVDHNHTTGTLRGLLCIHCNTALGHLREDPALFLSALDYLSSWGECKTVEI